MTRYFDPSSYISLGEFMSLRKEPGIVHRIERLNPTDREAVTLAIKQFDRAENGDRIRPDLLPDGFGFTPGKATMPENNYSSVDRPFGWAKPHSERETHRPDMTEADKAEARSISERVSTELAVDAVQARFRDYTGVGTDADRPVDTSPPSLRETLESASRQFSE